MKAPKFWGNPKRCPGFAARILLPASWIFSFGGILRHRFTTPQQLAAPVICIGNLIAGGAGKTPSALAICERVSRFGVTPHLLARGYGGRIKGPHRVDPLRDSAVDVGDEPLVMSQRFPVWVGADRRATGDAAICDGADILVMDDGFQNPNIEKDLSIVVIDAIYGHGNGRVIPAGPLREPLSVGFERADAVFLLGAAPPNGAWPYIPEALPVFRGRVSAVGGGRELRGKRVVAFAGIGRPEKFFALLRRMKADVLETAPFPDHYSFSAAILSRLEARARALGAILVTTEKDAARLPAPFLRKVAVLPVTLGFAEPEQIDDLLAPIVALAHERRHRQLSRANTPRF